MRKAFDGYAKLEKFPEKHKWKLSQSLGG